MMKFNKNGLFAMLGVALGIVVLVHDSIMILKGGSYTPVGVATLLLVLVIASESAKYIEDRLNR